MPNPNKIDVSVITSSSLRILRNLFAEVEGISGVKHFDPLILREVDFQEIHKRDSASLTLPQSTRNEFLMMDDVISILACEENWQIISDFIKKECCPSTRFPAIASYIPDIASIYEDRRQQSINALVNIISIAIDLKKEKRMNHPIIEIVCGSVLEQCRCPDCSKAQDRSFLIINREKKWELLIKSLRNVVEAINTRHSGSQDKPLFTLGLEIEPGDSYLLNSSEMIDLINRKIKEDILLKTYVGFNLDIAHLRILNIQHDAFKPNPPPQNVTDLTPLDLDILDRVVHAHIADHPALHTLDQPLGRWTHLYRRDSPFVEYIRLLKRRKESPQQELPFSGAIAIELEGCNRLEWIHQSIVGLQRLIDIADNYPT